MMTVAVVGTNTATPRVACVTILLLIMTTTMTTALVTQSVLNTRFGTSLTLPNISSVSSVFVSNVTFSAGTASSFTISLPQLDFSGGGPQTISIVNCRFQSKFQLIIGGWGDAASILALSTPPAITLVIQSTTFASGTGIQFASNVAVSTSNVFYPALTDMTLVGLNFSVGYFSCAFLLQGLRLLNGSTITFSSISVSLAANMFNFLNGLDVNSSSSLLVLDSTYSGGTTLLNFDATAKTMRMSSNSTLHISGTSFPAAQVLSSSGTYYLIDGQSSMVLENCTGGALSVSEFFRIDFGVLTISNNSTFLCIGSTLAGDMFFHQKAHFGITITSSSTLDMVRCTIVSGSSGFWKADGTNVPYTLNISASGAFRIWNSTINTSTMLFNNVNPVLNGANSTLLFFNNVYNGAVTKLIATLSGGSVIVGCSILNRASITAWSTLFPVSNSLLVVFCNYTVPLYFPFLQSVAVVHFPTLSNPISATLNATGSSRSWSATATASAAALTESETSSAAASVTRLSVSPSLTRTVSSSMVRSMSRSTSASPTDFMTTTSSLTKTHHNGVTVTPSTVTISFSISRTRTSSVTFTASLSSSLSLSSSSSDSHVTTTLRHSQTLELHRSLSVNLLAPTSTAGLTVSLHRRSESANIAPSWSTTRRRSATETSSLSKTPSSVVVLNALSRSSSGRSATSTASLSRPMPQPPMTPAKTTVQATTDVATKTAVVASVMSVSPTTATDVARIMVLQSVVECQLTLDVDDSVNLFSLRFGPTIGEEARGAVIGNSAFCLGFSTAIVILCLLASCVADAAAPHSTNDDGDTNSKRSTTSTWKSKFFRGAAMVHFPSLTAAVCAAVMQPTVMAAVSLFAFAQSASDYVIAVFGVLWAVGFVVWVFVSVVVIAMPVMLVSRAESSSGTVVVGFKKLKELLFTGTQKWIPVTNLREHDEWVKQHQLLFADLKLPWFTAFDVSTALVFGIIGGIPRTSRTICLLQAFSFLLIYAATLTIVVLKRPIMVRFLECFAVGMNVCGAVAAAALVSFALSPSEFPNAAVVVLYCGLIMSLLGSVKMVVDVTTFVLGVLRFGKHLLHFFRTAETVSLSTTLLLVESSFNNDSEEMTSNIDDDNANSGEGEGGGDHLAKEGEAHLMFDEDELFHGLLQRAHESDVLSDELRSNGDDGRVMTAEDLLMSNQWDIGKYHRGDEENDADRL